MPGKGGGTVGRVVYKDKVLKYLATHPGQTVWRDDIGISLGLNPHQISNVLSQAVRDNNAHVLVVETGKAWRWVENPSVTQTTKKIFEELATLEDGRILAVDESGTVYWVTKVK